MSKRTAYRGRRHWSGSRAQHVYGFRGSFADLRKTGGIITPSLVGVKEASTFTGFCEGHDGRLFKPIDVEPLEPTREQISLLSYRALCREIMGKTNLGRGLPFMRELDRGRPFEDQLHTQLTTNEFTRHVSFALPDLRREQTLWHEAIAAGEYERFSYALIRLGSTPDIACSGVSQPDKDFAGRMLLDLREAGTRQDDVAFALVATDSGGLAVFGWLDKFREAEDFVTSLLSLSTQRIPNQLVRYAFETFDNVWLCPSWWEGLAIPERQFLVARMNTGGLPYDSQKGDPYSLRDNGMRFVNWTITGMETSFK